MVNREKKERAELQRILCFISYFQPGYRAGGPIKTISNMVSQLEDDLQFSIITRNHDLGAENTFSDVHSDSWNKFESFKCFYCSKEFLRFRNLLKIINLENFDVLYFNSFFDFDLTVKLLIARRFRLIRSCPVVLAPRGEFSQGALSFKSLRKRLYINIARTLGLLNGLVWQASTEMEKRDIIDALNVKGSSVFVAKDLPSKVRSLAEPDRRNIHDEASRIVFLSRISPIKNLKYALEILQGIREPIVFDIYGPIEDDRYWRDCLQVINRMPEMINVNYCGVVSPVDVSRTFANYDLFFFPSRGENFGHVIAEALSVGTPVLLSDRTPWRGLENDELGWELPLDNKSKFVEKILEVVSKDIHEKKAWRATVFDNVAARLNSECDRKDNVNLFKYAIDFWENSIKR